jgi:uncharacterized protein (DUF1919 family)
MINKFTSKARKLEKRFKNNLAGIDFHRRVKNLDFTIISSNCWGSSIYQELGVPYNTPFVGLFFFADCFIKFLKNLEECLNGDFTFITESRYPIANESRLTMPQLYPIGLIKDDIEVHFLHYASEKEVLEKWHSRRERMNMDNLFIGFSDRGMCEDHHLKEFDRLDFSHKVVFTAKPHPDIKSAVWIKEYSDRPYVENLYLERYIYKRHFDVANWLNGGSGRTSASYRLINKLFEVPYRSPYQSK